MVDHAPTMAADTPHAEIGKRLIALRLAFAPDMTQAEWAESHGVGRSRYNNWETGERRIPVEMAERLADRYSLSLDWIYRNKMDGLSETALKKLIPHLPR